jgi:hypothetical protein
LEPEARIAQPIVNRSTPKLATISTSERPNIGTNRGYLGTVNVASLDSGDPRLRHTEPIGDIGLVEPRYFSDLRKPGRQCSILG